MNSYKSCLSGARPNGTVDQINNSPHPLGGPCNSFKTSFRGLKNGQNWLSVRPFSCAFSVKRRVRGYFFGRL